jgi:hypothetical protein
MTNAPIEYTSNGKRAGEYKLEAGTYEVKDNGDLIRVDSPYDAAADKFKAALEKLGND